MNALSLALRSLDHQTFEVLVCSLLKSRYPNLDIKHVNGASGDQGLDIISGQLDSFPTVWQCKSFSHSFGDSQKQQIRDSLKTALKYQSPRRWVLCISSDLDAPSLRWWQKFVASRANTTEIQLLQGTDIIEQLLYKDTIREQFFPGVGLNAALIREALAGTNLMSAEGLAELNDQNIGAYLARLEQMDARFSYAITHSRNQSLNPTSPEGTIATISRDHTTIHVTPRDIEALRESPPQGRFTILGTGIEKLFEHQRTGKAVTLTSEEVAGFTSDFDFLLPSDWTKMTLQLKPAAVQPTVPLRVTFGKGGNTETYEYILFQRTSVGSEQCTLESTTPLPFPLTLVFQKAKHGSNQVSGSLTFQDKSIGYDVVAVNSMAKAIRAAFESGEVDFYSLASQSRLARLKLTGDLPIWLSRFERFLDDACAVANFYGVRLLIPEEISTKDHRALVILRSLHTGLLAPVKAITLTLDKLSDGQKDQLSNSGEGSFRLELPEYHEELCVFGKRILTGPLLYEIPKAKVRELERYRKYLQVEPIEATETLTIEPIGDLSIRRISTIDTPK